MTFTRPKAGPKSYLSRGPSGHAETFQRCSSDHRLEHCLGKTPVVLAVDGFIRKMRLEKRIETWEDVRGYLAEMTKLDARLVPVDAIVAFWARIDKARADESCAAEN